MKEFEIWEEGYAATGQHSGAYFIGKAMGETFDEACINFKYPNGKGLELDKKSNGELRRGSFRGYIPPGIDRAEKMVGNYSMWACQLFPTEAEARKSFG